MLCIGTDITGELKYCLGMESRHQSKKKVKSSMARSFSRVSTINRMCGQLSTTRSNLLK